MGIISTLQHILTSTTHQHWKSSDVPLIFFLVPYMLDPPLRGWLLGRSWSQGWLISQVLLETGPLFLFLPLGGLQSNFPFGRRVLEPSGGIPGIHFGLLGTHLWAGFGVADFLGRTCGPVMGWRGVIAGLRG